MAKKRKRKKRNGTKRNFYFVSKPVVSLSKTYQSVCKNPFSQKNICLLIFYFMISFKLGCVSTFSVKRNKNQKIKSKMRNRKI